MVAYYFQKCHRKNTTNRKSNSLIYICEKVHLSKVKKNSCRHIKRYHIQLQGFKKLALKMQSNLPTHILRRFQIILHSYGQIYVKHGLFFCFVSSLTVRQFKGYFCIVTLVVEVGIKINGWMDGWVVLSSPWSGGRLPVRRRLAPIRPVLLRQLENWLYPMYLTCFICNQKRGNFQKKKTHFIGGFL